MSHGSFEDSRTELESFLQGDEEERSRESVASLSEDGSGASNAELEGVGGWADVWEGLGVAAPIALTIILHFASGTVTLLAAGRYFDEHAFTGLNLGFVTGNLVGMSFVCGLSSALDTLQPIAFGAKDYAEVGDLAVRGVVVPLIFVAVCCPMWFWGEAILVALGQPAEAAYYAGEFLTLSYPAVLFNAVYETIRRFHACQGIFWPWVAIAAAAFASQLLFLFLALRATEFAFACLPLSVCVFWGMGTAFAWAYCRACTPHHLGTWPGFRWSALAFSKIRAYLALAVPGLVGYSDWWFWEVVCLMIGTISEHDQAAHAAAYMVIPVYFIACLGLGIGANVKIGNEIGKKDVPRARAVAKRFQGMGIVASCVCAVGHWALKPIIINATVGGIPEAVARAETIWIWTCAMTLLDAFTAVDLSITRAIGQQKRLCIAVAVVYWAIGLPLVYLVALKLGVGLLGVWIVYPCLYVLIILATQYIQRTSDWSAAAGTGGVGDTPRQDKAGGSRPMLAAASPRSASWGIV
eukprot:TRINITY_DN17446_c0_g1_i1.p1 TRINITY_DN17446_c0_g1~~TRINITY_DN17446_c0_g1_i1.p1  ORF type:complete len:548 (+),score=118.37 TRINITY_DN17446_c0_g1_i1:78-1646(+)